MPTERVFCSNCGGKWSPEAKFCPSCGAQAGAPSTSTALPDRVKAASQDAMQALRALVADPVSGLPEAFEALGTTRALHAGLALAAGFDLLVAVGVYLGLPRWSKPGAADVLKLLLVGLVPVGSVVGASALARQMLRGRGSIEGDVFVAGASLAPFGLLTLFGGILGLGNAEVIGILAAFATSYTILMLYSGSTRVSMIPTRAAAPAVAITVVIAAWLTKIIVAAAL